MRQKWTLVKQVRSSKIIIGDINNPFPVIDRTSRQKDSKSIEDLNTINQIVLIDMYRTIHPTTVEYTLFSKTYEYSTR